MSDSTNVAVQPASSDDDPTLGAIAEAAAAATAPPEGGLSAYLQTYIQRLRGGETGSLPAIAGLVVLSALFWILHRPFGTLGNFANLLSQAGPTIFIAMGLVFVLLLGEIDLAAGTAGGVAAAVMARLSTGYGYATVVTVGAAILTGIVIGVGTGYLCAKIRIPSFVVTLALFLAFQGVVLWLVNNGKGQVGNLTVRDKFVVALENGHMSNWAGWLFAAILVAGFAATKLWTVTRRIQAGLPAEPLSLVGIKVAALAVGSAVVVYLLNEDRSLNTGQSTFTNVGGKIVKHTIPPLEGVPWIVPLTVAFLVVLTFLLTRTRYGRHVYAVGGNTEASRRAGIPVDRIRISVFVVNSTMAAVAGLLLASRTQSVDAGEGGGNVLLLAVGAAVVGGTSLFGGKGRPLDAIIGGLVLAVIANGMADLVQGNNGSAVQYVVTGAVLLLAAAVDALARRRSGASGLG
jgi:D-xylose transport system permease protein